MLPWSKILVASLLAVIIALFIQTIRLKTVQYEYSTYKQTVATENRNKTAQWKEAVYNATYNIVAKRKAREQELENIIDGLRHPSNPTVRYVVRERFSYPNATSTSGGNDAETGRGLSTEDVEFLLREARRADSVVETLQMLS